MGQASGELQEFASGAQQSSKQTANQFQATGEAYDRMGKTMTATGAAILAPMIDAVRTSASLEQAMDQTGVAFGLVQGKSAEMDAQYQALNDTILDVASSTIFGAQEVADAATVLGKAGISVEDVNNGMLQSVADFAAATGTQLPMAADIMSRTAKQWGLSGEDMVGVADDLTTVFNETSLSAEDFLGGMANFAPQMRLAGSSLEDTAAALGFFKDQGLSARESGTSLTRAMDAMISPTDKQTEAMANLGITTEDFFRIGEDGQREFIGWADTFDMLNEKMTNLDDIQKAAALSSIFGKEAFDAMGLGMLSNTDKLRDLNEEMKNNEGVARDQSAALTDNLLGSIEQLGGAYDKLKTKMGDPFLDPLKEGVEGLTDVVNSASELDPHLLGLASKFATLTGGLLAFGGGAAWGAGQLFKLAGEFARSGKSLPIFARNLGLAGLAIGAGLAAYETNFLGFGDAVDGALEKAGQAVDTFGTRFDGSFNTAKKQGMNDLAAGVHAFGKALDQAIGTDVSPTLDKIANAIDAVGDASEENAINGVQPLASALDALGKGARALGMEDLANQLEDASRASTRFGNTFERVRKIMQDAHFNDVAADLAALGYAIDEALGTDVAPFFEKLAREAQIFGTSWEQARKAGIDPLTSALLGARDVLSDITGLDLTSAFDGLGETLRSAADGMGSFLGAIRDGNLNDAIDMIGPALEGAAIGARNALSNLTGLDLGTFFDNLGGALMSGVEGITAFGDALASGNFGGALDMLSGGIQTVGDKIGEVDLGSKLQGLSDQVMGWLQDVPDLLFGKAGDSLGGPGEREGVEGIIPQLADNIASGLQQLPSMVVDKLGDAKDMLAPVGDWLGDQLQSIGDTILGNGEMPAGLGGTGADNGALSRLADQIASGIQQLPSMIGDKLGETKDFFAPVGQWLSDQLTSDTSGLDTIKTAAIDYGTEATNQINDGIEAGLRGHGANSMGGPGERGEGSDSSQGVQQLLADFKDSAVQTIEGATRASPELYNAAGDLGQDLGTGLGQALVDGMTGSFDGGASKGAKGAAPQDLSLEAAQAMGAEQQLSFGDAFANFDQKFTAGVKTALEPEFKQVAPALADWFRDKTADLFSPTSIFGMPNLPGPNFGAMVQGVGAEGKDKGADELAENLGESMGQMYAGALGSDKFKNTFDHAIQTMPHEVFTNMGGAMLDQITRGMATAMKDTEDSGERKGVPLGQGIGQEMVDSIATGLTETLDTVKPETFAPVAGGLLSNISDAIGVAMKDTAPAASEESATTSHAGMGMGTKMVQSLATGLTDSITAADPKLFTPVGTALSSQLGTALQTALMDTDQTASGQGALGTAAAGGGAVPGAGLGLVQGLATGLAAGITAAPVETFLPVSSALQTQLGAALAMPVVQAPQQLGQAGQSAQDAAGQTGSALVQGLATGLAQGITDAPVESFLPVSAALQTQLGAALAMPTIQGPQQTGQAGQTGEQAAGQTGSTLVQGLATGLADSITNAPPEMFLPVGTALGTQLGTALQTAMTETQTGAVQPGQKVGSEAAGGLGTQMVQNLATGLTDSVTNAPPELFTPVGQALGLQLGTALQTAMTTAPSAGSAAMPGGMTGTGDTTGGGLGQQMVSMLASGLTTSVTDAPPELFTPVGQALGNQLGTALQTALTQAPGAAPSPGLGAGGAPQTQGMGTGMVQQLATGLGEAVTATPVETFAPVGDALSAKMGEAVSTAMQNAAGGGLQAGLGGTGGDGGAMGTAIAEGLSGAVESADFSGVGSSISTKLSEALQTAVSEGASGDIGAQLGESISEMLSSAVESADFSGVGEAIGEKLTEALKTAISDAASEIGDAVQDIVDAISEALDGVSEAVSTATEDVSTAVADMATAISDAVADVETAVSDMATAVSDAASDMETAASDASTAAEEIGTAASTAATAVETAMQAMAAAVQAAAGAIASAASSIIASLNAIAAAAGAAAGAVGAVGSMPAGGGGGAPTGNVGYALTEGVAEGMESGYPLVESAGAGIGETAYNALADEVGYASPAKSFMPIGAGMSQGVLQGMLTDAKSRLQSAMGKMGGAVESAMGRVKSSIEGAMGRVHEAAGRVARGSTDAMGQEAASGRAGDAGAAMGDDLASGVAGSESGVTRAARKLARKALDEVLKGKPAMRFLGEDWATEFWEGMLSSAGSVEFAQYLTQQVMAAASTALRAVQGQLKGLARQIEIVKGNIDRLTPNESAASSANDAMIDALNEQLAAQRKITAELEKQFQLQFDAAHKAHVKAVQAGGVGPEQADYESKLAAAQQSSTMVQQAHATEDALEAQIKAVQAAAKAEADARVAAQAAADAAELAAQKALLASLEVAQRDAQVEMTRLTIEESNKRIQQAQKELKHSHGMDPMEKAGIKATIQLEKDRIGVANQLAEAVARVSSASNPAELEQANAQVEMLTAQLAALDDVDVGSLLSEAATKLGEAATALNTAASSMSSAASSLSSGAPAEAMASTAKSAQAAGAATQQAGQAAEDTGAKFDGMGGQAGAAMKKMHEDAQAMQDWMHQHVQQNADDVEQIAADGAAAIGSSLSEGITAKIQQGAPALRQSMLDSVTGATDAAATEAAQGGKGVADQYGGELMAKMKADAPKFQEQMTSGLQKGVTDTTKLASQGGKEIAGNLGDSMMDKINQDAPKFQTEMGQNMERASKDTMHIASQGGRDVGDAMGDGMMRGVQGRAGQIANEAASTVRAAIQAAHDAARNGSPSREMMEVGDMMGLGLIVGMHGRQKGAEDASERLVHIPHISPTSGGGVTGGRAKRDAGTTQTIHIARLELPNVQDPQQFLAAMEDMTRTQGVSSGRSW